MASLPIPGSGFARLILVAMATLFLSVTASADTLEVTAVNYSLGENTYLLENGVDTPTYAGEADILLDGTTSRTAYCVAIFIDINMYTVYNTSLTDISAVKNGLRVGWLLDNVLPTLTTAQQGAGLQMAIWDIVNDNADGFSSGGVQAATTGNVTDPTALADAVSYESQSIGKSADAWVYYNTDAGTGAQVQTLMGFVKLTDGGPAVPEPATLGVVTLGMLIGGITLRRNVHKLRA